MVTRMNGTSWEWEPWQMVQKTVEEGTWVLTS